LQSLKSILSQASVKAIYGEPIAAHGKTVIQVARLIAYSGDVNGRFQRDVNGHSGHVNKVGAQRRWDYNHARHLRD